MLKSHVLTLGVTLFLATSVATTYDSNLSGTEPPTLLPPLAIESLDSAQAHSIVIARQAVPGVGNFFDVLICIPRALNTPADARAKFAVHLRSKEEFLFSMAVDSEADTADASHELVSFAIHSSRADELQVDMLYMDTNGPVLRADFYWLYELKMGSILGELEDENLEAVLDSKCGSRND